MSKQRVYKVSFHGKTHLVYAKSPAAALKHIASSHIAVQLADVMDVAKLVEAGTKVETAAEEQEAAP